MTDGSDAANRDEALARYLPAFADGADLLGIPEDLLPQLAEKLIPIAMAALRRAASAGDVAAGVRSVRYCQRILEATADDDGPEFRARKAALGFALGYDGRNRESLETLDEAIRIHGEVAADTTIGTIGWTQTQLALVESLVDRSYLTDGDGLETAARIAAKVIDSTGPDHPQFLQALSYSVISLDLRYSLTEDIDGLTRLIEAQRLFLASAPDGMDKGRFLLDLSRYLYRRHQSTTARADLDEAVDLARQAVATAVEAVDQTLPNGWLAELLKHRYQLTGQRTDINQAVSAAVKAAFAAPRDHPARAAALTTAADVFETRFDWLGEPADLDQALRYARESSAATPAETPPAASRLMHVASVLAARSRSTGDAADLNEAVGLARHAAASQAHQLLDDLGKVLAIGYEVSGALELLDEAIECFRAAENSVNLSNALAMRHERTGDMTDLNESIELARLTVVAPDKDIRNRAGNAANLVAGLLRRYERTAKAPDLDEAIDVHRRVEGLLPAGHVDHGRLTSLLAMCLVFRYRDGGDEKDLARALQIAQEGLGKRDETGQYQPVLFAQLGWALLSKFDRTEQGNDLDNATYYLREAVASGSPRGIDQPRLRYNLAVALRSKGDGASAAEAVGYFCQVMEDALATPTVRILAARAAGELVVEHRPSDAAAWLEIAVRLMPETVTDDLSPADRQHAVSRFADLASDAAALALASPLGSPNSRAVTALGLLEMGRAILLSQALRLRTDVGDLSRQHPVLAERLLMLRRVIQGPSVVDRRAATREITKLLAEIRGLDGFASFALPPGLDELRQQAHEGPIVTINVSRYRSDALILTAEAVTSLPLPALTRERVIEQTALFHDALSKVRESKTLQGRSAEEMKLTAVLEWLWVSVGEPVLERLGYTTVTSPDTAPRLWWVPTGVMSLLPLHAAMHESVGVSAGRSCMDRVVSSYTPTISALRHARESVGATVTPIVAPSAVLVAMPETPGLPDGGRLRFALDEVTDIAGRLTDAVLLSPTGPAERPIRANVLRRLPEAHLAHFACHGVVHPTDPSKSRLLLEDHVTAPLTVAALMALDLRRPQLAYLSACETAVNANLQLLDESIHLASAFQLAGFPRVVGTLWAISDRLAMQVSRDFYDVVLAEGAGFEGSAVALHRAVRTVREASRSKPSIWAAYLHLGA